MTVKGMKGLKNRNFPSLTLEKALAIPRVIQDDAAGKSVTKVTLANLLERSPGSSAFEELLMASRFYGLTTGGAKSPEFALTDLGDRATGADEVAQEAARREAVLGVPPFKSFLTEHDGKKAPALAAFKDFLVRSAGVPEERAEECIKHILEDARFVGFIRQVKGGAEWIELGSAQASIVRNGTGPTPAGPTNETEDTEGDDAFEAGWEPRHELPQQLVTRVRDDGASDEQAHRPSAPRKVFIAHGKDRGPLEQLKKMLDQFKVPYAVAIDEPHGGRPISAKVANLMRDTCSSGIFIFTADEKFLKKGNDGEIEEVWRPSENVVYELGAASILYDRRIVIFKEERVTFPSDFSDLGHITFRSDQLVERMGDLFGELVKLDILEVRAKG